MADVRTLHLEAVEFAQPCPSIYKCRQCSDVNTTLLRARCGHGFCSRCVNQTNGKLITKFRCPVDSSVIEKTELSLDFVKDKVLQLETFCLQRKRGCKRTVLLRDLEKHLETCGFVPVGCPCNCGLQVCKRDLAGHLAAECDHRLILCDFCNEEMAFKDKQAHYSICNKKPLMCPHCKTKYIREELSTHEEGCILKPHKCQFSEVGCDFKGGKKEVQAHEKDVSSHLGVVVTAIVACQKAIQVLEDRVASLQTKHERLNDQVQKILPSLESVKKLENQVCQIEEKLKENKPAERNHVNHHPSPFPSVIHIQRKPSTSEESHKTPSPPSSTKSPSLRGLFNHVNSTDERPRHTAPPTAL